MSEFSFETCCHPSVLCTPISDIVFASFSCTLYSEYVEFQFTTVGSNWPDYTAEKEADATVAETEAKRWRAPQFKPLKRIGKLIRRRP